MLFTTDDSGTCLTNTRDRLPLESIEVGGDRDDALERIVEVCRTHTVQLSERRLDLPAAPPHMLEPNLWMANAPGSTLFMPVGDASEQAWASWPWPSQTGMCSSTTSPGGRPETWRPSSAAASWTMPSGSRCRTPADGLRGKPRGARVHRPQHGAHHAGNGAGWPLLQRAQPVEHPRGVRRGRGRGARVPVRGDDRGGRCRTRSGSTATSRLSARRTCRTCARR